MQPMFPGHPVFFDGNVNAKGLKPIHRKLGHRCGKRFIDPRTFEGLAGVARQRMTQLSRTAAISQLASEISCPGARGGRTAPKWSYALLGVPLTRFLRFLPKPVLGCHLRLQKFFRKCRDLRLPAERAASSISRSTW